MKLTLDELTTAITRHRQTFGPCAVWETHDTHIEFSSSSPALTAELPKWHEALEWHKRNGAMMSAPIHIYRRDVDCTEQEWQHISALAAEPTTHELLAEYSFDRG